MLRPHCKDVLIKGLIKYQLSAPILLHGDPNNEFQLELDEFIFCRHILPCYVRKYSIIVLKLIGSHWAWHEDDMLCDVLDKSTSLLCCSL